MPSTSTTQTKQIDAAPWRQFTRDFFASRLATGGFAVLLLLLLIALFAPLISPQNPYDLATLDVLDSRLAPNALSSDGAHRFLLGSDEQGRDMLSAIFYGLRIHCWSASAAP